MFITERKKYYEIENIKIENLRHPSNSVKKKIEW